MRAAILAPILAWLAVILMLYLYFNPRGRWLITAGPEGYRVCFGAPPPRDLRVLRCEAHRHYRLTGELLSTECYVQAEGGFDTTSADWRAAPRLADAGGLPGLVRERGLSQAPDWFRTADDAGAAKVLASGGNRLFSVYPIGTRGLLIGGGWKTWVK